ncbi:TetR/AcrR family transcriptional regulator [Microvirga sp. W0021]|uniref:TetR/AcrR family transcriptional regulator n=1 Tax=Hohaiivirga grylli TaxID=3133970 RepID=A0ABV0BER3_9HYPH
MSRTAGSSGVKTLETIKKAALRLIYEHGYDAMTLRGLANKVGIQQGSLYNYFKTKQELLFMLVSSHMEALTEQQEKALAGIDDPVEALRTFIRFHIDYHISRKHEVFVNYSELRSFTPENYKIIADMRSQYENRLIDIIIKAQKAELVPQYDAKVAAYGILAMLTGICQWFNPKGRLSKEEVITTYMSMALSALQVRASH